MEPPTRDLALTQCMLDGLCCDAYAKKPQPTRYANALPCYFNLVKAIDRDYSTFDGSNTYHPEYNSSSTFDGILSTGQQKVFWQIRSLPKGYLVGSLRVAKSVCGVH